MKWSGWGDPAVRFEMEGKPALLPWIRRTLQISGEPNSPPIARHLVRLPASRCPAALERALVAALPDDGVSIDEESRLLHAFGKSYPDLLRVRRGQVDRPPDIVVFPSSHDEVIAALSACVAGGASVIPFGGGTNIVGGVNPGSLDERPVVSMDLRRMDRLLRLDEVSDLATFQAGVLGPALERQLEARGYALGHQPDSFEFSSLGGWIATRSAGMQSDAYGKIEDMVVALRLGTPAGELTTGVHPRASVGPDLDQMILGSEGVLGVITEATVSVHRDPPEKSLHGFLFPSFEDGVEAIHGAVRSDVRPTLFRLSDADETDLSFHMKGAPLGWRARWTKRILQPILARRFPRPCLSLVGFEGETRTVRRTRAEVFDRFRRHGGFHLGQGVAKTWSREKYALPYLRDYVMDLGVMVDVAETAMPWAKLLEVHRSVRSALTDEFARLGRRGYVGCHVSHTYPAGACLYFTFAAALEPGQELDSYQRIKGRATEALLAEGAALSHHHAIGTEHRPWVGRALSPIGVRLLRGLKDSVDPNGIMNPGKLLPDP